MTRIDRRVRRTRRLLREALLALVLEQGYEQITIQQITDRADLSRATFYLHYKDKDELLADSLEALFDELVQSLDTPVFDFTWREGERPPSTIVFQHVAEYQALYRALLLGERGVTYVINRALDYIARIAAEQVRPLVPRGHTPPTPVPVVAHQIAGALFGLILWWLANDLKPATEHVAGMFQRTITAAVSGALNLNLVEASV